MRVAAQTFRPNPALDTEATITALGVGEALVSVLDAQGTPTPVEHVMIRPPASRMGPLTSAERQAILSNSVLAGVYDEPVDRESAYQILQRQAEEALSEEATVTVTTQNQARSRRTAKSGRAGSSMLTATATSAMRSMGTQIGRQIVRGLLGSLTGRRRR